MNTKYFVYARESKNQISKPYKYRKLAVNLCNEMNIFCGGWQTKYAVGSIRIDHHGVWLRPAKVNYHSKIEVEK